LKVVKGKKSQFSIFLKNDVFPIWKNCVLFVFLVHLKDKMYQSTYINFYNLEKKVANFLLYDRINLFHKEALVVEYQQSM